MPDYPYILKPNSLRDFLSNIHERPEPPKITLKYLKSLGYTSSNDRPIISVLKFINFVDRRGVPTELFKKFRDTRISKAIMAQTLKESYAELFKVHASPYSASDEDLENFFRTETGRGGRMLQLRSTHLKFCAILQTSKSHLLHRHHFLQLNKLRHQP